MKKWMTLVAIWLIAVMAAQALTLQKFFEKYADDERFQYVSINKGMMNMGGIIGGISKSDAKAFSKMNNLKILTYEAGDTDLSFLRSVEQEINQIVSSGKFETAVEVRDKSERVNIYYRVTGSDNADMLIITRDKREFNCIWINGKMTKEEMMNSFSSRMNTGDALSLIISGTKDAG
jgi:hypothetical protein